MKDTRQLYPMKFIPIASKRPWGGDSLIKSLGKDFTECDEEGNETRLTAADRIGESWELADMGFEESIVAEGWLAGNTIEEVMETYLERIVGEDVYQYYGRQFPLLVKFLDIRGKLSVQVHPDDEIAGERYDALGKSEIWYIMDAAPDARIYMGFNREVTAQEFYDRCHDGTVEEILNVIYPKKGDSIFIRPGTVHAAEGGLLIAEIQESSDLTFRLYDWGRENDPKTARQMHLEEAIDLIDYNRYDASLYRHSHGKTGDKVSEKLVSSPEFTATLLHVTDPLHIYTGQFGSFIIYVCIQGEASIQVPSADGNGEKCMDSYVLKKGETVLIPADMPDFFIVPADRDTLLIEAMIEKREDMDDYIDPDTDPYLEGEDYEGLENGLEDEDHEDGCACHGHIHGGHGTI